MQGVADVIHTCFSERNVEHSISPALEATDTRATEVHLGIAVCTRSDQTALTETFYMQVPTPSIFQ